MFWCLVSVSLAVVALWFACLFQRKGENLEDSVVLITGAGAGLGRDLCLELCKYCKNVIGWDVSEEGMKETARLALDLYGVCTVDVQKAAEELRCEFGRLTILINNAAIVTPRYLVQVFLPEMLGEAYAKVQGCIPGLIRQTKPTFPESSLAPHGHFVFTSSIAGQIAAPGLSTYCASKAALSMFAETLSLELARLNIADKIHVTDVRPFFMNTQMFSGSSFFPLAAGVNLGTLIDDMSYMLRATTYLIACHLLSIAYDNDAYPSTSLRIP
ncbi:unnamed protein product [Schistocephalus solidus]|uniref:Epidermal retinol dehydrogenase 2 n=1 Tax=Schistocephalus solidus TaxID=70667 RepID=A0A183SSI8_SCHSO|nr:unnamed protein product [Schistocephalus solidus]